LGTDEGEGIISVDLATMEMKRVSRKNKYHGSAYEYQRFCSGATPSSEWLMAKHKDSYDFSVPLREGR
jgi:hypothetical protein